jgi:Na+-driven multidrug efflux pump
MTRDRIKIFCDLYFPDAFGSASDFWRVAAIGAVAAKMGEKEVAVFNTSYRVMWITLIIISALSQASGVKISMRLGKLNPVGAKQAGEVGLVLCFVTLCFVSLLVLWKVRFLGTIFTNDEDFLLMFEECSVPFTATLFLMNFSIAIEKIPYSMGRTSEVFWMGLIASWGFQVPGVLVCTTYWRKDLVGLYTGMSIGYLALCILYGNIAFRSDWEKYAILSRSRSEARD